VAAFGALIRCAATPRHGITRAAESEPSRAGVTMWLRAPRRVLRVARLLPPRRPVPVCRRRSDAQQRDRKLCLMDHVSIEDLPNDDVEALKAEMRAQA
jgi:hypothetical protein